MTLVQDVGRVEHGLPLVVLRVRSDDDRLEPWLRSQIDDALGLRPERLVVDLSQCEVMTSGLLYLLLAAHRAMRRRDGRLTLRGLSPRLVRVIGTGGLAEVLDVEPGRRVSG